MECTERRLYMILNLKKECEGQWRLYHFYTGLMTQKYNRFL